MGLHQVSWIDVLAQASLGSGRAVVHRTSLAIWLLWPGPHIGSGHPYPFAFRSPSFCLPAWSILDIHRACIDLEAQPGKDSLHCATLDDLTGIVYFFLPLSLERSSLQTCCHLQCIYIYIYIYTYISQQFPAYPIKYSLLNWIPVVPSSAPWLFQIRTKPPWRVSEMCQHHGLMTQEGKNSNFLTRKYHHKLVDSIPLYPIISLFATG